jgi:hypothetical protein
MRRSTARRRASLGADYLTRRYGPDWPFRVNVSRLNVMSGRWCLIGQLNPHNRGVLTDLAFASPELGFWATPWALRTQNRAWVTLITQRRAAAVRELDRVSWPIPPAPSDYGRVA